LGDVEVTGVAVGRREFRAEEAEDAENPERGSQKGRIESRVAEVQGRGGKAGTRW